MSSFRCRGVLQNSKTRSAALGPQTGGLAPHELISLLVVKAVTISLLYFPLLAAKPASVGCAARAAAGAADALHNSTPKSRHRRAAGRDPPAHRTPLAINHQPPFSSCESAFSPFSSILFYHLLSNFVLPPFFQPSRHKIMPLAFHPGSRVRSVTRMPVKPMGCVIGLLV